MIINSKSKSVIVELKDLPEDNEGKTVKPAPGP